MKLSKQLTIISQLLILSILLITAFLISQTTEKPFVFVPKQQSTMNIDNRLLEYFHMGQKRLISSFLWIATILESDQEHYKARDLNSWMYLRFLTISNLEPKFFLNYSFGGVYLSIIKDDLEGATDIFNKGLNYYPDDFSLLRDASFHFYYEVKDLNRAYELAQVLKQKYPQKFFLLGMITKLDAEKGNLKESLATLNKYQEIYPKGSFVGDKIFKNRYALKAEIDLQCLNHSKDKICNQYDLNNVPYIKTHKGYKAATEWVPYRRTKRPQDRK